MLEMTFATGIPRLQLVRQSTGDLRTGAELERVRSLHPQQCIMIQVSIIVTVMDRS